MSLYIGENIKKLRKERDLTQEMLAKFLNVSYQSVSKWERGESYPDITLVPAIASFFGVTTDTILGIKTIEQENKIKNYLDSFKELSLKDNEEARALMKQATTEFPGNYKLLSCYLSTLVSYGYNEPEKLLESREEAERVYEIIQNYCTDDSIRVRAKSTMCSYLESLSRIESSGVDISAVDAILAEMPLMNDAREIKAMMLYPHDSEKRYMACASGFSALVQLLGEMINRKASCILERDVNAIEAYLDFVNAVMPDGDYGRSWYLMIFNYGYLGVIRHNNGDDKGALEAFRKEAELAVEYEAMPEVTTHTSYLVEGLEFNKATAFKGGSDNIAHSIRDALLEGYPLSDEFRATDEFKAIIDIIK
ncbi:MAG: helix-turn-helix transcriptional regulator [Clostridia bacterium]|nr:helix-turn-helix transcriptional regulator [Clostridia bacterium]